MKLHLPGRRPADPTAAPDASADLTGQLAKASGKGRPTPKRSEAQGRRQGPPPPPPTSRKEAYRRMRQTQAVNRGSTQRAAALGDDSALRPNDRGPVRKLVRDVVDSRRNVGSVFLVVAAISLVGTVLPNLVLRVYATYLLFLFFIAFVIDSVILARRLRRAIAEKYPNEPARGAVRYGITRTTMIRRWRYPRPSPQADVGH